MTVTLQSRLRAADQYNRFHGVPEPLLAEAADALDRLTAENAELRARVETLEGALRPLADLEGDES